MLWILVISTFATLVALAMVHWTHSQYHLDILVPSQAAWPEPPPKITVIVPARNEARNIERCVQALLNQTYPNFELLVIDDRSTDATPQILRVLAGNDPRLRVLSGQDPPPGWAGKPHALWLATREIPLDPNGWLCFVDADTFAQPQMLTTTLVTAQAHAADMFSMLTGQELGSFWERVILPVVFTALSVGFPARHVNNPSRPEAIANGQFILIQQAVYAEVGGHAAVHAQVAEDKALAELVKGQGYRLVLGDGRPVASTRMYTNLSEIWEGWTKNIYLGMQGRMGLLLVGGLTALAGALVLPLWLAGGLVWLALAPGVLPLVVTLQALLVWLYLLWMRAQAAQAFHISPGYAFTLPLGALVFALMMFASAFLVLSGRGVRWKGRTY